MRTLHIFEKLLSVPIFFLEAVAWYKAGFIMCSIFEKL